MRKIIFLLLISVHFIAKSQEVMMDVKLEKDTLVSNNGANQKHYKHFYGAIGFAASSVEGDSLKLNYGKSNEFIFGYRYKYKIANFYALGFDMYYSYRNSNISNDTPVNHLAIYNLKKRRYIERSFGTIVYNRFNFGKRGNKIGKFIDLGAFAELPVYNTSVSYFTTLNYSYDKFKIVYKSLNFYSPFNYGLNVRMGYEKWILFANYRISNGFKSQYKFAELPRLTAGLQIGFY